MAHAQTADTPAVPHVAASAPQTSDFAPLPAASAPLTDAAAATEIEAVSDTTTAPATLGEMTVSGAREGASTRLPLTARETPQSVSTVGRQQIERQSLTSVDAVLRRVPGLSVSFYDTQRPLYYSRGFKITDFQIDGLPTFSDTTNQEFDTALYERVDIVRGANGILTGVGVPSATINLIRKRPRRQFGASVALTAGSWDLYRAELDLNAPLTQDGSVRSRLVLAPQKRHSFRDRYQESKLALLGLVEADVGSSTVVALGYQWQNNDPKAPIWGTIPRFAADGSLADLPVSSSFSPPWTRWWRHSGTLFATVDHQINDQWALKAAYNHTEGQSFSLRTYAYGATTSQAPFIDMTTGRGATLYAGLSGGAEKQDTLDAYLSGKLDLGGRQHDITAGISGTRTVARADGYTSLSRWSHVIPNVFTWDGNAPEPAYSKTGAWKNTITQQLGLYGSARWRLGDKVSLLTGARLTHWRRQVDSYSTSGAFTDTSARQNVRRQLIPYLGVVVDVTPAVSAYASHTRIFNPQNYRDKNNDPLAPAQGSNSEVGLKAELLDGRLQGHFAVFETRQNAFGVIDSSVPPNSLPDNGTAYKAVNGTKAHGFELGVSGRVRPGWDVQAGLTYIKTKRAETDLLWANFPDWQLQLGTDYRLRGALAPLSIGGDLAWQSRIQGFNIPHPSGKVSVTQKAYTLLNLRASWHFSDKTSLTLAVNNVLNTKYWANLDYPNYGDPRSASLTLRTRF
ncbi:TonB-dependent siderophore receptor [Ottowia testudinis]|uniref:TonB-dependent siderophore receptor n=2 Tax=Ottowia testudinis TaxID=2816950 RepID=A0A975CJL8_9BURK|nr:TonB-dependent siderophore receptor [Ottowia testudinis]